MRRKNLDLFKNFSDRFGDNIRRTTIQSRRFRPVSTKTSMHLLLKSDRATGDWSMLKGDRRKRISQILRETAKAYGLVILSAANVGNHIHLHIRVKKRWQYIRFIRVVTAKISFFVTGTSKSSPLRNQAGTKISFWTQRPLTRFVHGLKDYFRLSDYIKINQMEGLGWSRANAEYFVYSKEYASTA